MRTGIRKYMSAWVLIVGMLLLIAGVYSETRGGELPPWRGKIDKEIDIWVGASCEFERSTPLPSGAREKYNRLAKDHIHRMDAYGKEEQDLRMVVYEGWLLACVNHERLEHELKEYLVDPCLARRSDHAMPKRIDELLRRLTYIVAGEDKFEKRKFYYEMWVYNCEDDSYE